MADRRTLLFMLARSLLVAPLSAFAQQTTIVSRIGYLRRTSREPADIAALRLGLRELGYVEGRNLIIDERYANGVAARLRDLARELVERKVRLFVVDGGATVRAVREVDATTPIVFTLVGDPVSLASGWVRSLDHPGGNITGLSTFNSVLPAKRLQLLRELVPARRVGVLSNPTGNANSAIAAQLTVAARSLAVELFWAKAKSPGELPAAFAQMSHARVGAVLVDTDAMFFSQRARIVDLAAEHALPAVYGEREFADAGGLMSYATNVPATFRHAAIYVDKILKGEKPGNLPIQQPTRIELVVNATTAKMLALNVPESVMVRADHVIP